MANKIRCYACGKYFPRRITFVHEVRGEWITFFCCTYCGEIYRGRKTGNA